MATFFIEQFGCRATQADAAAIERQLVERGYAISPDANSADVIVVNTCTVTAAADLQARQSIRTIHRQNPAARVIVTGCYAQRAPEELAALEGVSWVVGNSHKPEIPRLIQEMEQEIGDEIWRELPREMTRVSSTAPRQGFVPLSTIAGETLLLECGAARILTGDIREQRELLVAPVEGGEAGHTRPVLKIQDGCNKRCSYCVIPQVRGRSRSLAPRSVIEEIRKLCEGGAREVVLSGIDLGNYGRDLAPRAVLGDLLRRILDETPVERLRVSSVEPMDITEDLIAIFAASERMARHVHMPLQSGSDRILAAMHRWYRAEHYARHAELAREWLPDAAIGADVIAGFPGETEADHEATLSFIERLPLTYLHVFSFSSRPGTAAAEFQKQVPEQVIARRARELRVLGEKKKSAFQLAQSGHTMRVLTLNRSGKDASGQWTRALSSNYLDARVSGVWPANQFLDVRISGMKEGHLMGASVWPLFSI
jgi:threonylcarbamoyladenosine tRNA methylthiotransferase MtaB